MKARIRGWLQQRKNEAATEGAAWAGTLNTGECGRLCSLYLHPPQPLPSLPKRTLVLFRWVAIPYLIEAGCLPQTKGMNHEGLKSLPVIGQTQACNSILANEISRKICWGALVKDFLLRWKDRATGGGQHWLSPLSSCLECSSVGGAATIAGTAGEISLKACKKLSTKVAE